MADYISSKTKADTKHEMDRQTIGSVDIHYATKGNFGKKHKLQGDRASCFAVPGLTPKQYELTATQVIHAMQEAHAPLTADKNFTGMSSVTVSFYDPKTGKCAIASNGDASVYIKLSNKDNPKDIIIKRISTPFEEFMKISKEEGNESGIPCIDKGLPIMWANHDSWQKPADRFFAGDEPDPNPQFELLDIREIADAIIRNSHPIPQPQPTSRFSVTNLMNKAVARFSKKAKAIKPSQRESEGYEISLIIASDGITPNKKNKDETLATIENAIGSHSDNEAQAILDYISNPALDEAIRSVDNLSAVVLRNLTFGEGETIATCVCDGNHDMENKRKEEYREGDGPISSQAMIDVFEQEMQRIREHGVESELVTTGEHRSRISGESRGFERS